MTRRTPIANGLLPPIRDDDIEWLRASSEIAPDPVTASVGWLINITEMAKVVWPATVNDELRPPPLEHILDHLTRRQFGDSGSPDVQAEFALHAEAGTVAVLDELPDCLLCARKGHPGVEARYDGLTASGGSFMSYMCGECYLRRSTRRLGSGEGQYLMREEEIPTEVEEALACASEYWRGRGA